MFIPRIALAAARERFAENFTIDPGAAILILEVFNNIFILIFIVFAGCSQNSIFHIPQNAPPRIGAQGKPDTPVGMVFKFS
jgi:hypothetical protein